MALLPWAVMAAVPKRLLLIPLDDRPAATQFAQMIADMAGATVELPPASMLGHFVQPGHPEEILAWLERQDLSKYDAVVASTDMLAYGGLIASRVSRSSYELAIRRLRTFWRLRKSAPRTRVYAFSSIMRLAPTATKATAAWRLQVGYYAETKERYRQTPTRALRRSLENLKAQVPAHEIERYEATRARDHMVQRELVRMTASGVFDYLVLGQDDAQPFGPHVPETRRLKEMVQNLGIGPRVYFCEGIDQHSNVLVSRALLSGAQWQPRVRVVYADEQGRAKVAAYESDSVENSLNDQLVASGACPVKDGGSYDYSLYVNTPSPRPEMFAQFRDALKEEIDQGFPVAVADVNLGKTGTGDPGLFDALIEGGRSIRLLSYAGWNTAGNTMGTAIPAANVYLLARKEQVNPLRRELARRKFLLHRLVDDFEYHRFVRPQAYALIDSMATASREETYGAEFDKLDDYVRQDLTHRLLETFLQQLKGSRFYAGAREYEVTNLTDIAITLPWPRAYEVRLQFEVDAKPVETAAFPVASGN